MNCARGARHADSVYFRESGYRNVGGCSRASYLQISDCIDVVAIGVHRARQRARSIEFVIRRQQRQQAGAMPDADRQRAGNGANGIRYRSAAD
jgi:hypothetical protein